MVQEQLDQAGLTRLKELLEASREEIAALRKKEAAGPEVELVPLEKMEEKDRGMDLGSRDEKMTFEQQWQKARARVAIEIGEGLSYPPVGADELPVETAARISVWLDNLRQREETQLTEQIRAGELIQAVIELAGLDRSLFQQTEIADLVTRLGSFATVRKAVTGFIRQYIKAFAGETDIAQMTREWVRLPNYLWMRERWGVNEEQGQLLDEVRKMFGLLTK